MMRRYTVIVASDIVQNLFTIIADDNGIRVFPFPVFRKRKKLTKKFIVEKILIDSFGYFITGNNFRSNPEQILSEETMGNNCISKILYYYETE
jgi:hypothetical protein